MRRAARLLGAFPFISPEISSGLRLAQKVLSVERLVSEGQGEESQAHHTSR